MRYVSTTDRDSSDMIEQETDAGKWWKDFKQCSNRKTWLFDLSDDDNEQIIVVCLMWLTRATETVLRPPVVQLARH